MFATATSAGHCCNMHDDGNGDDIYAIEKRNFNFIAGVDGKATIMLCACDSARVQCIATIRTLDEWQLICESYLCFNHRRHINVG